ncbi:class I SAM-dependent methyltransferase [Pandoraea sputorum]|uniref:Aklanonic acid methyltransferase DauC n=1 Tax=Pandoraea sputorum TaxID=93222 RepID=A0A5E5B6I4_9BURK|nr:class I SAM-dependent methyltransferase [Pandoraea sputorum]VVE79970.1 Aklanonic acid methyltransferase DauC [Pandoraea sputorum]
MAQITSGVRSILSTPAVYDFVQNLLGAKRGRRDFVAEFVKPTVGQRVLDIGCGTAEILPFLPCVDYEGFDISAEYINAARARHGERGKFHCRLFTDEDAGSVAPADIVLAVGLLHHLDDIEASTFIELAKRALKPGGRLVTLDPCYDSAQTAAARYLVSKDRGQNVRDAARYEQLTTAHFEVVQCAVRHRRWIPYTHCAMVATNLPASTSVDA